jgi:hypothetical protein
VAITDAINFVSFLIKGELMDNDLKRPANTRILIGFVISPFDRHRSITGTNNFTKTDYTKHI